MTTPSPKVVNSVSAGVSFFSIETECFDFGAFRRAISGRFGVPFRGCTVHIYIYNSQKTFHEEERYFTHIHIIIT